MFFASTNDKDFLRDPTGNRRFWPVDIDETTPIKNVFEELDQYEVDQIWAEAVKLFKDGETLYLSAELEQLAFAKQTEHSETDDRSGLVQGFLDTLLPESWPEMDYYSRRNFIAGEELGEAGTMVRQRVSIAELWCELFGKQKADMTKFNTRDLHTIMRSIVGWEESKAPVFVKGYGRQRVYRRIENLQNGIHEGQNGIHGKKVTGKQGIQEVYRNFN